MEWNGPTWVPLVGDFLKQTCSQLMNSVVLDSKSLKLLDVLMEILSNESSARREIQVCRTFICEISCSVCWIFALSIAFLLKLGFRRSSVELSSDFFHVFVYASTFLPSQVAKLLC